MEIIYDIWGRSDTVQLMELGGSWMVHATWGRKSPCKMMTPLESISGPSSLNGGMKVSEGSTLMFCTDDEVNVLEFQVY
jgi:hypothetical protein